MAIIGNPWAQDAAAFGQQTGQALSQGLLQLPQERYEIALRNAQMQRAMQQQQALQQYHQGVLGIRQQGLDNQSQQNEMANQIRLLTAQNQGQHYQAMEQRPMNLGGGNFLTPQGGGVGQGQPTQQGLTNSSQQDAPQQSFGGFQLQQAPRQQTPMTQNQSLGNQLKGLQMYGMGSSVTNDPAVRNFLMNNASNIVQQLKMQQGLGQQQMTNQAPQMQQQTNRVFNYNPLTGQLE